MLDETELRGEVKRACLSSSTLVIQSRSCPITSTFDNPKQTLFFGGWISTRTVYGVLGRRLATLAGLLAFFLGRFSV